VSLSAPLSTTYSRVARAALCVVLLSAATRPGTADAQTPTDDKRACAEASEEAQLRRIHNKIRGARDELLVCARDVCPPLVKHDCEQWLAEVDASMPTLVVSALDAQGRDVGNVRVEVDGQPFLDKLDGNAVAIDPGEHAMRFVHEGDPDVEQKIIVREGEKNRLVSVRFGPPPPPVPLPAPATPPVPVTAREAPPREAHSPAVPIFAYSLFGAGAVALGLATYFEVEQLNDYSSLKNGCSLTDSCKQSQVDTIANERVYAGVFLGVGLAAAGAGTLLLLTRPRGHGRPPGPAGATFDVTPTRGGGAASFRLTF
jgi:hypothetical protein